MRVAYQGEAGAFSENAARRMSPRGVFERRCAGRIGSSQKISGNDGRATETVSARNRTRRGAYVFLDVYLPAHGATAAGYRAVVTTTR